MTSPLVGVLAVQGGVQEHVRALESCGARTRLVRRPAELEDLDGLVLPGGESTTIDKLLRAYRLQEPLRAALAGGLPAYGSCAGMILLADRLADAAPGQQTLGGLDVLCRRNAFGRQRESFEQDLDVTGLDDPVRAVFIRAPWLEETGPDVEVLATARDHPVLVRQAHLLASSFHPELTGDPRVHGLLVSLAGG